MDITVAIPTYNGEKRLPQVIERLTNQNNTANINWEIIIVDNNSVDHTSTLIQNYQKSWNYSFPLRLFLEKQQGAAFARLRAACEARGELIAFLDDDNLPDFNWLSAIYSFGKKYPQAGAWGGQIHGEYEVQPPDKFNKILRFLAIREYGSEPHLFKPESLYLPPGAAFVVRKHVWCENVPQKPKFKGILPGGVDIGGEDFEALLYIHRAGWQIWCNPDMHTYHQIPSWRLEKNYLLNIAYKSGLCMCKLRFINAKTWQKPFIATRLFLGSLLRVLPILTQHKGSVKDDIIALSEMTYYWGNIVGIFKAIIP